MARWRPYWREAPWGRATSLNSWIVYSETWQQEIRSLQGAGALESAY